MRGKYKFGYSKKNEWGGQIGNRKKPVGGIDIVLLYPLAPCVTTLAIIVGSQGQ